MVGVVVGVVVTKKTEQQIDSKNQFWGPELVSRTDQRNASLESAAPERGGVFEGWDDVEMNVVVDEDVEKKQMMISFHRFCGQCACLFWCYPSTHCLCDGIFSFSL